MPASDLRAKKKAPRTPRRRKAKPNFTSHDTWWLLKVIRRSTHYLVSFSDVNGVRERHSARNISDVGVLAAMRPGIAATTLASTRPPMTMKSTDTAGTVGEGTALISRAKRPHRKRPTMMPSGTPTTVPKLTAIVDCQAMALAS